MSFSIQSIYNWYRNTIRNPKYRWWLILGTLLYLFSPIDVAPDFIPVVGWLDDAVIMTLLVSEVSQLLIDYVKLRQGKDAEQTAGIDGESFRKAADTVDVNSVSVD